MLANLRARGGGTHRPKRRTSHASEGGIRATVDGGVLQILDNAVTLLVDEATLEEDEPHG